MPGFNQQQLNYSAQNANSVMVLIGTLSVAFAQTVSHSFDFGTEGFYGVGSAMPQEIQQLRVSPQITIDSFALTAAGEDALSDGTTLAALIANNSFNFFIVDNDGNTLFTYVGGVASNFNQNIPANQPITDAITFLCMDVLGVSGLSLLNTGGNAYSVASSQPPAPVEVIGV